MSVNEKVSDRLLCLNIIIIIQLCMLLITLKYSIILNQDHLFINTYNNIWHYMFFSIFYLEDYCCLQSTDTNVIIVVCLHNLIQWNQILISCYESNLPNEGLEINEAVNQWIGYKLHQFVFQLMKVLDLIVVLTTQ